MPTNASITNDHAYHIDLSDDPGWGGVFQSFKPEAPQFDDMIKGVGNCSWQISFSAKDEDGATIVIPPVAPEYVPFVGPYRSYFRLRYGRTVIMAGPIVSTDVKNGQNFVSVSGKTWENYLERWQHPFDPRVTPTDSVDHVQDYQYTAAFQGNESSPSGLPLGGSGLAYECYQRDVVLVVADILGTAMYNVPYRHIFDISRLSTGLSGIHTNLQYALGDDQYMDSFINSMFGIGQGVDWWISWDQKFYWATPYRFGTPANPTLAYTVDTSTPLIEGALGITNNGPAATHLRGKGAGFAASSGLQRAYGYAPAQQRFTRLDKSYDFGDFRNKDALISRTQKQLSLDLQPQHEITLQLEPAQIPNFWSTFRKGRGIWITYDLVSNRIDSLHQIMSYTARDENNSGNVLVDLTLEQRFVLDVDVGTPEG